MFKLKLRVSVITYIFVEILEIKVLIKNNSFAKVLIDGIKGNDFQIMMFSVL